MRGCEGVGRGSCGGRQRFEGVRNICVCRMKERKKRGKTTSVSSERMNGGCGLHHQTAACCAESTSSPERSLSDTLVIPLSH